MAKNLDNYTKDQLMNIGEQLMIEKKEMVQAKKSTIITKINDKAEELSVNVPEPEVNIEMREPAEAKPSQVKPRRIADYPRIKVALEARDNSIKQQAVGINEYQALVQVGEEVMLPEPVVDMLESLTDTIHVKNNEGSVEAKKVSRFYVKRLK